MHAGCLLVFGFSCAYSRPSWFWEGGVNEVRVDPAVLERAARVCDDMRAQVRVRRSGITADTEEAASGFRAGKRGGRWRSCRGRGATT